MQVSDLNSFFNSFLNIQKIERNSDSGIYRCSPPHLNSALHNHPSRIYGGTLVAYCHIAAKLFFETENPTNVPNSIFVNFIATGNCETFFDLHVSRHSPNHVLVETIQNGRCLARAFFRNAIPVNESVEWIRDSRNYINYVKPADHYHIPDLCLVAKMDTFAWSQHRDVMSSPFDIRPVEFGATWQDRPHSIAWIRIPMERRDQLQNIPPDSLLVYLSDYYIVQSVSNHLRKNGRFFKTAITLNHQIELFGNHIHRFEWFLFHSVLESMSNDIANIRVVVFSESHVPLALIRQQLYAKNGVMVPTVKISPPSGLKCSKL